jgi:hypothetical protein
LLWSRHPAAADQFVFFAASDASMLDEELLRAPARIVHIPAVVGAWCLSTTCPVSGMR